jgi:hypothetical protein
MDKLLIRDIFKWVYTFVVLFATLWWGKFCIDTFAGFAQMPEVSSAEAILGMIKGAIEGALITWTGLTVQFWFRKSPAIT